MAEPLTDRALNLIQLGSLDHEGFIGIYSETVSLMDGRSEQLGPILMEHGPPHVLLISGVRVVTLFEDGGAKIGLLCNSFLHLLESGLPEPIAEVVRGGLGSSFGAYSQLLLRQPIIGGVISVVLPCLDLLVPQQLLHKVRMHDFTREMLVSLAQLDVPRCT